MELAKVSLHKFAKSLAYWSVSGDYVDPIINYMVHGFEPGSFYTSLFANDAFGTIQHSHTANKISVLKNIVGWIRDSAPRESYGSYETVKSWLAMSESTRRYYLEQRGLVFTIEEELMETMRSE